MTEIINALVSVGGVIMQIVAVILLFCFFFNKRDNEIFTIFSKNGVIFSFLISLGGMIISLYYSEIAGFEPCVLCWYQRIFLYSTAFILGLSLFKKDKYVIPYAFFLSLMGSFFALYHTLLPFLSSDILCGDVSCTKNYFTYFGYITIPVLSLTSFILVAVLLFITKDYHAKNS